MAQMAGYYHIGCQQGRVPMQVHARRPDDEGGVVGTGTN